MLDVNHEQLELLHQQNSWKGVESVFSTFETNFTLKTVGLSDATGYMKLVVVTCFSLFRLDRIP